MIKVMKKLHRWVGIAVAVYVVLVCISGVVHIIAHNFYHGAPAKFGSAVTGLEKAAVAPAQLDLRRFSTIEEMHLRTIDGILWYQVISGGRAYYFNAENSREAVRDEAYAKQLARDYLGKQIDSVTYVTQFNSEYGAYKNTLPVYKVTAGDEWVYVSTINGKVQAYLNQPKAVTSQIFRNLHMFSFIPNPVVRDVFSGLMTTGLFAITIFGVFMFFERYYRKKKKAKEGGKKSEDKPKEKSKVKKSKKKKEK